MRRIATFLMSTLLLSACAVGPDYHRPAVETPPAFREASANGWTQAQPGTADIQSDWWTLFGDDQLNDLEQQVVISNQNLVAAEAAYRQARALVRENVSNLFPTIGVNASADRSHQGGVTSDNYSASVGGTWALDVWSRVRRNIEGAHANAQASGDDLASATLSAQAELAVDYIQLRAADEQKRLLDATVAADQESVRIAQNRYNVGVAARGDVAAQQSQLAQTQAQAIDLERQRAILEHAIAVLVGKPPAELTIAVTDWRLTPPNVPVSVPSTLLQRRPDVAAAERRAAAASAQIGVATSAFFPDITLSGSTGGAAGALADIVSAPNAVWSVGLALAGTLLDFGGRSANVSAAHSAYQQAVAEYRQTVLTAFQDVEDGLASSRVLANEQTYRDAASGAANTAEQVALNQYRAGIIDQTTLLVAQSTARDARIAALEVSSDRLTTAVTLIEALGGGWNGRPPTIAAQPAH
jgi:NodT family efflux transporter outer membrane factor (OMF) lipoprotein